MQKLVSILALCLLSYQTQAQMEMANINNPLPASAAPAEGKSKLILYRPNALAARLYGAKLNLGGQKIKLRNKQVLELEVPAGSYDIINQRFYLVTKKRGFQLNAEAGKTYYVRYRIFSDVFVGVDEFVQVEENFAKQELAKGKFKKKS